MRDDDDVVARCGALTDELRAAGVRVQLDDRTDLSFGRRATDWELKGVPVRLELGPRDLADGVATLVRRIRGRTSRRCARTGSPPRAPTSSTVSRRRCSPKRPRGASRAPSTSTRSTRHATAADDRMGAHPVGHRRYRRRSRARAGGVVGALPHRADGSLPDPTTSPTWPPSSPVRTEPMTFPVPPPVSPMLAKLTRELPDGGKLVTCSTSRSGTASAPSCSATATTSSSAAATRSRSRATSPSWSTPLLADLPERCVVDGEIVIATDHGLDFDALSLRIHPAESRVAMLAEETPASFVAFDLLADGDDDLRGAAVRASDARGSSRRSRRPKPPVYLTPATTRSATSRRDWFERFEGAGLDGVIAKPLDGEYRRGQARACSR